MQGEAASANVEATASYAEDLAKIANEGATLNNRFFHVNESVLYWKRTPSGTCIVKRGEVNAWLQNLKRQVGSPNRG